MSELAASPTPTPTPDGVALMRIVASIGSVAVVACAPSTVAPAAPPAPPTEAVAVMQDGQLSCDQLRSALSSAESASPFAELKGAQIPRDPGPIAVEEFSTSLVVVVGRAGEIRHVPGLGSHVYRTVVAVEEMAAPSQGLIDTYVQLGTAASTCLGGEWSPDPESRDTPYVVTFRRTEHRAVLLPETDTMSRLENIQRRLDQGKHPHVTVMIAASDDPAVGLVLEVGVGSK